MACFYLNVFFFVPCGPIKFLLNEHIRFLQFETTILVADNVHPLLLSEYYEMNFALFDKATA